jgi:hypothetical protein
VHGKGDPNATMVLGHLHTMWCVMAQRSGGSVSALKGTDGVPSIMSRR